MLSFELSAIDVVLSIAVLILLFLFVTRKPEATDVEPRSHVEKVQRLPEGSKMTSKTQKSKTRETHPQNGLQDCAHHFGYLRNLPRNMQVPDECFGCPKVRQCLFQDEIVAETPKV